MTPAFDNGVVQLYHGSALDIAFLADETVDMVCTSPPYWGLRDYGLEPTIWDAQDRCAHEWAEHIQPAAEGTRTLEGNSALKAGHQGTTSATMRPKVSAFCGLCPAWRGTLGLEPTPQLYVQHLVQIFREVRRVLKPWGTVWLNLGDNYAGSGAHYEHHANPGLSQSGKRSGGIQGTPVTDGLKPKDLVGIPWRAAFALQDDGWWLRSDIIWAKPNPMPESVTDRPTKSHEYLFLLTKAERYYYDQEAVREPAQDWGTRDRSTWAYSSDAYHSATGDFHRGGMEDGDYLSRGRNRRSVWDIATHPFGMEMCEDCGMIYTAAQHKRLPSVEYGVWDEGAEAWDVRVAKKCKKCHGHEAWMSHFATFPEAVVEPCILAGTSEKGNCAQCGRPWERVVEKTRTFESGSGQAGHMPVGKNGQGLQGGGETIDVRRGPTVSTETIGWQPTCACGADTVPAVVLDPFMGSGTAGVVAQKLGRRAVGVDQSEAYLGLARERIGAVPLPMVGL